MRKEIETASERADIYARLLPLDVEERLEAVLTSVRSAKAAPEEKRLEAAMEPLRQIARGALGPEAFPPCAPISRSSMAPEVMERRVWFSLLFWILRAFGLRNGRRKDRQVQGREREYLNEPWNKVARRRRLIILLLVIAPSLFCGVTMASLLPHKGGTALEIAIVTVFTILFAWISIGFWAALAGFLVCLRRFDRFVITKGMTGQEHVSSKVKTAVLYPVCNEEMHEVAGRIAATFRSLERAGATGFDFFILSDTKDPDGWVQEEIIWKRLCDLLEAKGRIFYRRRRVNLKRKSGNVADFCRRHGANYTYMVVMDADSVMSGGTLARMVRIMERRRNVGILQTCPVVAGRETLFARLQQFANRVYGPIFAAGLHFMQLGDSQFWGHNAIIRVKPFIKHCALPRLPGKPPLGGDILSHDFVESALMRRAGWGVWLALNLEGSWEESPPTLLAELKRDKRWCTGNMQHLRLVFTRGLFNAHRLMFLTGAMAYITAFLWFLFLLLSTTEAFVEVLIPPRYFPEERTLFPTWPVWEPLWAVLLLAGTATVLFLPKALSFLLVCIKGRTREYGGFFALARSIVVETLFSTLMAPIRMFFHSKYVFAILLGREAGWGRQDRGDAGTGWWEAIRFFLPCTAFAAVWGGSLYVVNPGFLLWISPILCALLLSIPTAVFTSRASMGKRFRRWKFFLTPEETALPGELSEQAEIAASLSLEDAEQTWAESSGFARAALDPQANALHLFLLRGPRKLRKAIFERRVRLVTRAVQKGPTALSVQERKEVLMDAEALRSLHDRVWQSRPEMWNAWWEKAGRPGKAT